MAYQQIFERVESKYLISQVQYDELMKKLADHIQEDGYPHSDISSVYFDSDDFRLIRTSLLKPAYREKLRLRCYGEVSERSNVFFEIKKKYKGVCYKRRQDMDYRQAERYTVFDILPLESQIMKEIDYLRNKGSQLNPKVMIRYQRDSFVGSDQSELRITFDRDIRFSTSNISLTNRNPEGRLLDSQTRIMEIKTLGAMPMWLSQALSDLQIYPTNFSKYAAVYQNYLMKGVTRKCSHYYSPQSSPIHLPLSTTFSAH